MTKREILLQAGRQLGDISPEFVEQILAPQLDYVLADLTASECLESARRMRSFRVVADQSEYDTREICQLTPHYPDQILSLFVPAWGLSYGRVERLDDLVRWDDLRLYYGAEFRSQWRAWRLYPNNRTLQVFPPASTEAAGTDCEILYVAPWHAIGLDDDVLDVHQEDVECLALGLQSKGAAFSELLQTDRAVLEQKYVQAKRTMWGRRWVTGGRLRGRASHGTLPSWPGGDTWRR